VFYEVVRRLLDAGAGVVAETNFHTGASEPALRRLAERRHAVLVHCHAPRALTFQRFRERLASGERHPYFMDEAPLAEIAAGQLPAAWSRAVPLDIGIPRLDVDTSDGYSPGLEEIAAFIRSR
jgi:hypothetical protein